MLDEPPPPPDCELVSAVGSGPWVITLVMVRVSTPAEPEVTLVWREVMTREGEADVAGVLELAADVVGAEVRGAEVPLPVPDTRPVMVLRVGAADAMLPPIVAYARPSCRAKKGRGAGDSWQHFTWILSALQHQLLS